MKRIQDFQSESQNQSGGLISKVFGAVGSSVNKTVDTLLGIVPKKISVLTYKEVVKHFTRIYLSDPRVKRAAVLRQPNPDGTLTHIVLLCLDQNNDPVIAPNGQSYTSEYLVQSIDPELIEVLDDSNNDVYIFAFN